MTPYILLLASLVFSLGHTGTDGRDNTVDVNRRALTKQDLQDQIDSLKETVDECCHCTEDLKPIGKDCADILKTTSQTSGVYAIQPEGSDEAFNVYCDMDTGSGGWTVFQRRQDGSEEFYRNWVQYEHGFGDVTGEFWLGNKKIHQLTNQPGRTYQLRVDLEDWEGNMKYAIYHNFKVGDSRSKYKLSIGTYAGTAGDSLSYHKNMGFTTMDADNDSWSNNCAVARHGGWWYKACINSNLNSSYRQGKVPDNDGCVMWDKFTKNGHYYSLKTSEMKVKPLD
ncbi:techylectin-5B-like [Glandiceps talaboti]